MERMESMEPISARYTTAYPEIQPDSGYESRETTDSQAKTPPPPTYDEELVHKVSSGALAFDLPVDGAQSKEILPLGFNEMSCHIMKLYSRDCFQTILVGDSGVGKTSLLVQFDQGKFIPGSFSATVGIGFTNKVVTVDGVKVKLQIWDTAGQERFRSVTHAYYRDAHALLLLYDITSKTSFDNIRAWLTEVHEYAQSDVVIMLLGNKADMSGDRAIRRDEGERLAREYSVPFMETSAKTGVNVELAFTAVAKELKHRAVQHPNEPKFQIHEYIEAQKEKSGCCTYF
ncbi:Ras-related protein [Collichthys lucidus]|uniref:small monomeric GTPase n=1 Tax=Collichthys lucidus TaxID=240159 RepID=A0A4U5VPF5_COLLU|nr:Ras-related protein [Collichthys lucidus]